MRTNGWASGCTFGRGAGRLDLKWLLVLDGTSFGVGFCRSAAGAWGELYCFEDSRLMFDFGAVGGRRGREVRRRRLFRWGMALVS